MPLQLDDVFAGVRMRRREKQRDAFIDGFAGVIAECREHCVAWLQRF